MRLRLPAAAGLLLALVLPSVVSAHEITDVGVDCDTAAIHISGKLFAQDGGATVTVSGPEGYEQSFFADQDEEWTVSLPLGANGTYTIDWPDSGDFGPVEFVADCAEGAVLPGEGTPTPTPGPEGAVLPSTGEPEPTLPPTDTATAGGGTGGINAGLGLLGLAALLTWVGLTAFDRRARARERHR